MKKQKIILLAIVWVLLIFAFAGYPNKQTETEPATLRVLVEGGQRSSTDSGTAEYRQLAVWRSLAEKFEADHEGMTVLIETLPAGEEEREIALKQLRTEIMAGAAPDVYLLPVDAARELDLNVLLTGESMDLQMEPLFRDVEQSMHDGQFLDISEYFNNDTELDKDNLNLQVLDGGCVGEARYVLPLRYTLPIVAADSTAALSFDDYQITTVLGTLAEQTDPRLFSDFPFSYFNCFSALYDYEREKLLLSEEELVDFLRAYRDYKQATQPLTLSSLSTVLLSYRQEGSFPIEDGGLCFFGLNSNFLDTVAIAKSQRKILQLHSIQAADGTVADITFWGAVGSSCTQPQVAYEFLRMALSEDVQFGNYADLWAESFPVRTGDAAQALWADEFSYWTGTKLHGGTELSEVELTDDDLAVLDKPISRVRFAPAWESDVRQKIDSEILSLQGEEELSAFARQLLSEITWLIQE